MIFCNLVGDEMPRVVERRIGKNMGLPISFEEIIDSEGWNGVSASDVCVVCDGEKLAVRYSKNVGNPDELANNLFALVGNPDEDMLPFHKRKNEEQILLRDARETDENPLILVLCKSIHIPEKTKANVKFINISSDLVLAMLIVGECVFEDESGEKIPMARCVSSQTSSTNRRKMDATELYKLMNTKDANGYSYNMDMLYTAYMYYGQDMTCVRPFKDKCVVFDPAAEKRAKACADAVEAKKRKQEEEAKRRKEETAKQVEAERKQREEREAIRRMKEEAAKAVKDREARAKKESAREIKTPAGVARNAGAAAFLSMLNQNG